MKSCLPTTFMMVPMKAGLQTSMREDIADTDTPQHSSLVSTKLSPTIRLTNLWSDQSSFAKMSSSSLQTCPQSDHSIPFSCNTSAASTEAVASHSPPGKMKSSPLTAHHPYLPLISPLRTSASHRTKMARGSHNSARRSSAVGNGNRFSGCSKTSDAKDTFLEGFQDCASEVVRFLRDVVRVEDSDPLLQGLQSHLSKVGHAICPENVKELDARGSRLSPISPIQHPEESQVRAMKSSSICKNLTVVSDYDKQTNTCVPQTPHTMTCISPPSPILAPALRADRQFSSSSEIALENDSDISILSTSTLSNHEKAHLSSNEINPDLINRQECLASSGSYEPHRCSDSESLTNTMPRSPYISSKTLSKQCTCGKMCSFGACHGSVSSPPTLSHLAAAAINLKTACHQACLMTQTCEQNQNLSQRLIKVASTPADNNSMFTSPPIDRSSPLLCTSHDTTPSRQTPLTLKNELPPFASSNGLLHTLDQKGQDLMAKVFPQQLSPPTTLFLNSPKCEKRISSPHPVDNIPPREFMDISASSNPFETPQDNIDVHRSSAGADIVYSSNTTEIPVDTDPAITWCQQPPKLSASSLSIMASHPDLLPTTSTHVPAEASCQDLLHRVSSVLELRPNFLPGVDSSSVASGNFADILLAVESCRSHKDARVRTLAEELIYLIHDDGDNEDDDDINDNEFSDDESDNGDAHEDESGIEMDDSSNWGNPADLIEQ